MSLIMKNVTVQYSKNSTPALQNISLECKPGELIGVLGLSGAGKSTMVRSINQLVKPTSGQVLWNDKDLIKLSGSELRAIRSTIGMIFQQFHLVPRLNVMTNVLLGQLGKRQLRKSVIGYFTPEERSRAEEALEQVGLSKFANQRVENLSGGQQQRVAIARMLVQDPQMVLGDEPVASLDPVTARTVMGILQGIHEQRKLITIVNLHDVELAKEYATRIIGLSKGKVVFDGKPSELTLEVQERIYSEGQNVPLSSRKKFTVLQ
jgi:phosphonate transport system ATP-binding protein